MISAPVSQGNLSSYESWSDYDLDAFTFENENIIGDTDSPEFQVISDDRTGKFGLIDQYEVIKMPCIYDHFNMYLEYDRCCVAKDGRNAVFNTNGQVIIPFGKINPLERYSISNNLIVGYNSVYDLQGNLKILLPTDVKVVLLSQLYATTSQYRGLYSLEAGKPLLKDEYNVNEVIDTHLIIVSKMNDGFTHYGIYDCISKDFVLPIEFTSIQSQKMGKYEARALYAQEERTVKSKTLILSVKDGKLDTEREDIQQYQTAGTGCILVLLVPLLLPLALLYLL